MSIEVLPFLSDATSDRVRTTVAAVPALRSCGGTCFVLLEATPVAPPNRGTATHRPMMPMVATTIERIATDNNLPTDPRAWFAACVGRIHTALLPDLSTVHWSACVGIVYQANARVEISFSAVGNVRAYLVRWGGRPKVTDVLTPQPPQSTIHFRNAMDGVLTDRDTLLLTIGEGDTAATADRIAFAQHLSARTSSPPGARVNVDAPLPPAAIAVVTSSRPAQADAHTSMRAFLATAATTERFVTPTLVPIIRAWFGGLRRVWVPPPQRKNGRIRTPSHRALLATVEGIRFLSHGVGVLVRSIAAIATDACRLLRWAAYRHRVPRHHETGDSNTNLRTPVSRFPHPTSLIAWYRALPRSSQLSLLLATTFAVLFLLSTTALWRRRGTEATTAKFESTIANIEELRSVAEAKLLFGDRAAASSALRSAEEHLQTLPRTTHPRRERAAVLEREIAAALDRARGITRISTTLLVAAATTTIPFSTIADITVAGDRLIVTAGDGKTIAAVDPRNGSVTTRTVQDPGDNAPVTLLTLDDHTILTADAGFRLAAIDLDSGARTAMTITAPPPHVIAAATARGRLYLLARDGGVTRHERTAGGFSRGTVAIPSPRNPTLVRGLATDGRMSIIAGEDTLARYEQSRKLPTSLLAHIDPPLVSIVSFAIGRSGDRLYLGDPTEGRVVVIGKDGALIGQIASPAFRSLRRIVVDPRETAIYVLHENTVSVIVPPKATTSAQ